MNALIVIDVQNDYFAGGTDCGLRARGGCGGGFGGGSAPCERGGVARVVGAFGCAVGRRFSGCLRRRGCSVGWAFMPDKHGTQTGKRQASMPGLGGSWRPSETLCAAVCSESDLRVFFALRPSETVL